MTRTRPEPTPGWLEVALWLDVSPVRPWEWPEIDAESWTEAIDLRMAWQAGIADARDEAAMQRQLADLGTEAAS